MSVTVQKRKDVFVQIGRVCVVNYGKQAGQLVTIVDIVDGSRALVDGPDTTRQTIPLRHLSLSTLLMKLGRGARTGTVAKNFVSQNVVDEFNKTTWGQKLKKQALKANLNDFQRFQVQILKKRRNIVIGKELGKLKRGKK